MRKDQEIQLIFFFFQFFFYSAAAVALTRFDKDNGNTGVLINWILWVRSSPMSLRSMRSGSKPFQELCHCCGMKYSSPSVIRKETWKDTKAWETEPSCNSLLQSQSNFTCSSSEGQCLGNVVFQLFVKGKKWWMVAQWAAVVPWFILWKSETMEMKRKKKIPDMLTYKLYSWWVSPHFDVRSCTVISP